MSRLIYAALLVLFLAPMAYAEDPKIETPKADAPTEEAQDCEEILAQLKEAKAVHNADYKEKGKAFNNWRKYNKELHSMSYEATDEGRLTW